MLPNGGEGAGSPPPAGAMPYSSRTRSCPYAGEDPGDSALNNSNRNGHWPDFGLQGSPRGLTLRLWSLSRPPPMGTCALMVEIAGQVPR
jgi:hypothetical protein